MFKCPRIGGPLGNSYLMADLQEQCFTGRHFNYMIMVTVPQLLVVVFGLPISAAILIFRNKLNLNKKRFFTRYGLLYMGYRESREWWELVIAMRKVAIVMIGTFGTFLGVVDLQAFVALAVVFVSLILHLVFQPFDVNKKASRKLHNLEFTALTVCFFTFWGGLLFFLGHEKHGSVSSVAQMTTSILLVGSNSFFLVFAFVMFAKQYLLDRKKEKIRKSVSTKIGVDVLNDLTKIVPINDVEEEEEKEAEALEEKQREEKQTEVKQEEDNSATQIPHVIASLTSTPEHHLGHFSKEHEEAQSIHDDFHRHEEGLKNKVAEGQRRMKRKTQLRLEARTRLKDSKKLHLLPTFSNLTDIEVNSIIDQMDHIVRFKGDSICRQDDVSDSFYVMVKGLAIVTVDDPDATNNDDEDAKPEQVEVGRINVLEFLGESALLTEKQELRTATVTVASDRCELLRLKKNNYIKLQDTFSNKKNENDKSIIDHIKATKLERAQTNRLVLERRRSSLSVTSGGSEKE